MECAFKANDKQLCKLSLARTIQSLCLCRLRSYRWCFDNLHFVAVSCCRRHQHRHSHRCRSPSRKVNTANHMVICFSLSYSPITWNINVELMIENFLSVFNENNLWNNDNRKCRLENSSNQSAIMTQHMRQFLSGTTEHMHHFLRHTNTLYFTSRNIWHFFCHQKAINLSSVDNRTDDFLR